MYIWCTLSGRNWTKHTHTHNHFTALWTLSGATRVSWYQKVHFAIFWIFWSKMKITQADAPTIWMDCHPIQTNWCPTSTIPTIFTQDALTYTTLPIYPGSGQATNMMACIPNRLWLLFTGAIFWRYYCMLWPSFVWLCNCQEKNLESYGWF